MTPRHRSITWSVTRHLLLLAGAAFILLPFIWMISTASKPQTEIFTKDIHFIPHSFAYCRKNRCRLIRADDALSCDISS